MRFVYNIHMVGCYGLPVCMVDYAVCRPSWFEEAAVLYVLGYARGGLFGRLTMQCRLSEMLV